MGQKRHSHDAARRRRRLRPGRNPAAPHGTEAPEAATEAIEAIEDVPADEVVADDVVAAAVAPVVEPPKPHEPVPGPPPSGPPATARPPVRRPRATGAPAPAPIREATGGLRGLVGAGPTQLPPAIAMRARDASRPTDEDIAAAERDLVIVRRHWTPPDSS